MLAVNAAEANPFTYHQDGRRTGGQVIRLGTGSRDVAVVPVSAPEARVASPLGGAGAPVEGNTRDALCVSKALQLLGWKNSVPADTDFETLNATLSKAGFGRKLVPLRPDREKWGKDYPGLLDSTRQGSQFSWNALDILCAHASPADKLLLRVYLTKEKTDLHCVAVFNGMVVDPADGVCRKLTMGSLEKLFVGELRSAYKLREL